MGGAMSSITINGDTSGSIILDAPAIAGSTTLTLPTTSGTLAVSGGAVTGTTGSFSGNLSFNSGYGSAAVAYGCRAWVNFNGTGTVAIRASGNVSSITDNGTGNYTVNFTTAMPDANYSVIGSGGNNSDVGDLSAFPAVPVRLTTSSAQIGVATTGGTGNDRAQVCIAIFR
jgi:hypothetical protein